MAKALYLKYRPQTFDEVEGQQHVTRTLKNALAQGRVAHAYLFAGPRGTGKTSTARILAKAVNCISTTKPHPCNECAVCLAVNEERLLDLIEIDAASNTGVDDIRDLREKVDFRPGEARFKVYIVDEAHMLSNAAFNALLKTLEEPPPHVIFVLATTEPNKIPATILSRCQRFDFRRATVQELEQQLSDIAAKEGLTLEPPAIELIARQATGSFRDATSLLDQLTSFGDGNITLAQVQSLLGAASLETISQLARALGERDVASGLALIGEAVDAGADPRQVARELVDYLRGVLLQQAGSTAPLAVSDETRAEMTTLGAQMPQDRVLRAIRHFSHAIQELRASASPTLPLEIALLESISEPTAAAGSGQPVAAPPRRSTPPAPRKAAEEPTARQDAPPAPHEPPAPAAKSPPTAERAEHAALPEELAGRWSDMLGRLRKVNKSTEALLRDAQALSFDGSVLTIGFFYELHKSRVEADQVAKPQIEKILGELFGQQVRIKCVLSPKKQKIKAAQEDPLVRAALSLGGKITDVS